MRYDTPATPEATTEQRRVHPATAIHRIDDLVDKAIGKKALVVDPACLDEEPMGWAARPKVYLAQIVGRTGELVVLARKLHHQRGADKAEETVKEHIPITGIKRFTVMTGKIALYL
jgi:hypothetical protein